MAPLPAGVLHISSPRHPSISCCLHPSFVLAQLRNFNSLRGISFLAAVMSLGYSTIATGDLQHKDLQH